MVPAGPGLLHPPGVVVGAFPVDGARRLHTAQGGDGVLRGHGRHRGTGDHAAAGGVGSDCDAIVLHEGVTGADRLGVSHIESDCPDIAQANGLDESVGVHDWSSRRVDQIGAALGHPLELLRTEEVAGHVLALLDQGAVDADDVRDVEEVVERHETLAVRRGGRVGDRVEADDPSEHVGGRVDYGSPDPAEADDSERALREVAAVADRIPVPPFVEALGHLGVLGDVLGHGEDQGHGMLGGGAGENAGRVADDYARVAGRVHINVVGADRVGRDDQQFVAGRVEHISADSIVDIDDQAAHSDDRLKELVMGHRRDVVSADDLEILADQQIGRLRRNLLRDQNPPTSHRVPPEVVYSAELRRRCQADKYQVELYSFLIKDQ